MNSKDTPDPLAAHLERIEEINDLRQLIRSLSEKTPFVMDGSARSNCETALERMRGLLDGLLENENRLGLCLRTRDPFGVRIAELLIAELGRSFRVELATVESVIAGIPDSPNMPSPAALARWEILCDAAELAQPLREKARASKSSQLGEFAETFAKTVQNAFDAEREATRAQELGLSTVEDSERLGRTARAIEFLADQAAAHLADKA